VGTKVMLEYTIAACPGATCSVPLLLCWYSAIEDSRLIPINFGLGQGFLISDCRMKNQKYWMLDAGLQMLE